MHICKPSEALCLWKRRRKERASEEKRREDARRTAYGGERKRYLRITWKRDGDRERERESGTEQRTKERRRKSEGRERERKDYRGRWLERRRERERERWQGRRKGGEERGEASERGRDTRQLSGARVPLFPQTVAPNATHLSRPIMPFWNLHPGSRLSLSFLLVTGLSVYAPRFLATCRLVLKLDTIVIPFATDGWIFDVIIYY